MDLSHSLGIAWYDAGSNPEFDLNDDVRLKPMLRSSLPMEEILEDKGWARSLATVFHFLSVRFS
jgi:hypothetical protein